MEENIAKRNARAVFPDGFESAKDTRQRRRRIKRLFKAVDDRPSSIRPFFRCRRRNCSTEACPDCMRRYRRQLLQAADVVLSSRSAWTRASVVAENLTVLPGDLHKVELDKIIKSARKRLQRNEFLRHRIVLGGLDISLNLDDNVVQHWQIHFYLLIEGDPTEDLKDAVKTVFPGEPSAPRPYAFREVKDRLKPMSYAYKSTFYRRSGYRDQNNVANTRRLPLKAKEERELLVFLGKYKIGSRLILHGVRRNGKPLKLQITN